MSTPVIEILGLDFSYPDGTEALIDIELHIHRGERVALLGPKGAGKTTLVLHMNGIHRAPNHLSFGQKRRVSMAGVMAMEPEILVLDEPTSNLDPASRQDLTRALLSLDVTQMIVTHDLLYALEVCPRSVIIDSGRIVADGPTRELLTDADLLAAHRLALPAALELLAGAPNQPGKPVN